MKIRFKLNGIEFECEFIDMKDMLQFVRNLYHNNKGKVEILYIDIEQIVHII